MARIVEAGKKALAWVGAGIVAVGVAILAFLKLRPNLPSNGPAPVEGIPSASPATAAAVAGAEDVEKKTKKAASAQADGTKKAVKEASKEKDGAKRRKRVADILRKS